MDENKKQDFQARLEKQIENDTNTLISDHDETSKFHVDDSTLELLKSLKENTDNE